METALKKEEWKKMNLNKLKYKKLKVNGFAMNLKSFWTGLLVWPEAELNVKAQQCVHAWRYYLLA